MDEYWKKCYSINSVRYSTKFNSEPGRPSLLIKQTATQWIHCSHYQAVTASYLCLCRTVTTCRRTTSPFMVSEVILTSWRFVFRRLFSGPLGLQRRWTSAKWPAVDCITLETATKWGASAVRLHLRIGETATIRSSNIRAYLHTVEAFSKTTKPNIRTKARIS